MTKMARNMLITAWLGEHMLWTKEVYHLNSLKLEALRCSHKQSNVILINCEKHGRYYESMEDNENKLVNNKKI